MEEEGRKEEEKTRTEREGRQKLANRQRSYREKRQEVKGEVIHTKAFVREMKKKKQK